ncbi:MAG TPA: hypothetical protein ENI82_04440 [Bacteroidetes bacterium]|nr:hypothetical protein [Bacteroidota bacterium]
MRNTGKKEIKDLILKKIERTRRKIVSYEEMTAPIAPENSIGRISRMDAINLSSLNLCSQLQIIMT